MIKKTPPIMTQVPRIMTKAPQIKKKEYNEKHRI